MSENKIFKVNEEWSKNALINADQYESEYLKSFNNNEEFWKEQGNRLIGSLLIPKSKMFHINKKILK